MSFVFEQPGSLFPARGIIILYIYLFFPPKLRVHTMDNNNSLHGKFHRFLFSFSSKFSDLNFASYVLYNLPCYVTCHAQWAWVTYGWGPQFVHVFFGFSVVWALWFTLHFWELHKLSWAPTNHSSSRRKTVSMQLIMWSNCTLMHCLGFQRSVRVQNLFIVHLADLGAPS